jgi:hypothetical protein
MQAVVHPLTYHHIVRASCPIRADVGRKREIYMEFIACGKRTPGGTDGADELSNGRQCIVGHEGSADLLILMSR